MVKEWQTMKQKMAVLHQANQVPVLLSLLVVILSQSPERVKLPSSLYELYEMAIDAIVERFIEAGKASTHSRGAVIATLQKVLSANHVARRRIFSTTDAAAVLAADEAARTTWAHLLSSDAAHVPLLKALLVPGMGLDGEYQ